MLLQPPDIIGASRTVRTPNYGSLVDVTRADGLHNLAHLRELYDHKINVATSFDHSSLTCHVCAGGPHQIMSAGGRSNTSPTCYILFDQNFPLALPSNGIDNCTAIIRVEDASLSDLVSTFMWLTRGCDLGVGLVVLISSMNHLGRVGTVTDAPIHKIFESPIKLRPCHL